MFRWIQGMVTRLLLIFGLSYAGVVGYFFVNQTNLLFMPEKAEVAVLKSQAAALHKALEPWKNEAGELIGWKEPSRPELGSRILLLHGQSGTALDRSNYLDFFGQVHPPTQLFLLDYPGTAARSGTPSEESCTRAAVEAVDWLRAENPRLPIILLGESLGSGVAFQTVKKRADAIQGILLVTPYNSVASVAQRRYPILPVDLILRNRFDSEEIAREWNKPVYTILAEKDESIPFDLGMRMHESVAGPKEILVVMGAGHLNLFDFIKPEAWAYAIDFILRSSNSPTLSQR